MSTQPQTQCPLNNDIFYDILRRLDGVTLAAAACACTAFSSISKEERIWENVCHSLWPSTNRADVKILINSIGGFRKFYADCYPLIVNKHLALRPWDSLEELPDEFPELDYYDESKESNSINPSDFVSLVDIRYKNRPFFSKVLWGISDSDFLSRWFYNSPFCIDLLKDVNDLESNSESGKFTLSGLDGLPQIQSIDIERKEGILWKELRDGISLSWIIINRKVNQAANVSSWVPLGVQRHWPTNKDFLVRFGSVLPAEDDLHCQAVECILLAKFRMFNDAATGFVNIELNQVSMQLEDMEGSHVNGRNSLLVLKNAMSCKRSRNYSEALECCNLYNKVRSELKEAKLRSESRTDRLCIVTGIGAVLAFWFCFL
ncbi:hypothetical protein RND81_05G144800 [Saponaria officinalis]|uniref:F-box protein n=1 Tax=Saponaria officinalis TaxID=3572 RepID=A0AAW1KZ50_SAPOF